jgi:hypothetical protein
MAVKGATDMVRGKAVVDLVGQLDRGGRFDLITMVEFGREVAGGVGVGGRA